MYEVFPVIAGVLMALLVPRFASGWLRGVVFGALSVVVAVIVTIAAGEEWFFVFIDLAEVLLALCATVWLTARLPLGKTSRRTVDAR